MVPRAVEPKTREDEPKISVGLTKIADEDPTFTFRRDAQTHELVISGMSELHLDVIQHRLKNRYKLDINTHVPHVPYLETITGEAEAHHRHKKQTGGRGQFADVQLRIRPRARGEGFNFVDAIKGGVIPNQYIPAVEKGVREQLEKGVISGNPVVDVEVEVFFGTYHAVDSSEQAFKTAAANAFRKAFLAARPVLLEPIVDLEVVVPLEKFGDITADLSTRRGHITGMEALPGGPQVDPGDRPAERGAPLRHRPEEHDRRPGLVHDGVQVVRAGPAQRPAEHRRQVGQDPGGHRGGVTGRPQFSRSQDDQTGREEAFHFPARRLVLDPDRGSFRAGRSVEAAEEADAEAEAVGTSVSIDVSLMDGVTLDPDLLSRPLVGEGRSAPSIEASRREPGRPPGRPGTGRREDNTRA